MSVILGAGGLVKRSMTIDGIRTSIALEREFWAELEALARLRDISLPKLVAQIDRMARKNAPNASLASSLRVFALLNRTGVTPDRGAGREIPPPRHYKS